jgi:hypothetical protein
MTGVKGLSDEQAASGTVSPENSKPHNETPLCE